MSLKDILVCKYAGCNRVYNDPRILPCGKRTCAAHIGKMLVTSDAGINSNSERRMIKCHFCEEIHSFPENSQEFLVDENIPLLLSIEYGKEHSAAKKSFNEVTQLIDKLNNIDQEGFVIDYFERVAADIAQEKEVNVQKLVSYYQQLADKVHERKVQCLHNLRTNKALESELDTIKQTLAEHETQLKRDNLDFILKTLDGGEDKWRAIQTECVTLLEKVRSLEEELQMGIIGDQMTEFKPSTHGAQIENICGNLDQTSINSAILVTDKMKNDLVALCKLSGKRFKMIYRATRDGFQASSFHAKCDHQSRTLTIIQTTQGYIFGGYTSVEWVSDKRWKANPNAFLFSLVNVRSLPQLMPVQVGDPYSIRCESSIGPTFGFGGSICISNNSNTTAESYSNLGKSYDLTLFSNGTIEPKSFLAGSRYFQTSEIEVFQLN